MSANECCPSSSWACCCSRRLRASLTALRLTGARGLMVTEDDVGDEGMEVDVTAEAVDDDGEEGDDGDEGLPKSWNSTESSVPRWVPPSTLPR